MRLISRTYFNGSNPRPTFVGDVIEGVRRAMDYMATPYEVIKQGDNLTIDLLEIIRALGMRAHLEHLPLQSWDVPRTWADVVKAERFLGFWPRTPFLVRLDCFMVWIWENAAAQA